jgi:hypothetical protein
MPKKKGGKKQGGGGGISLDDIELAEGALDTTGASASDDAVHQPGRPANTTLSPSARGDNTCSEEELLPNVEEGTSAPVVLSRLKLALLAFQTADGRFDLGQLVNGGFPNFLTETATDELFLNEPVVYTVAAETPAEEPSDVTQEQWVQELRQALTQFDADQDGVLSRAELLEFIINGVTFPEADAERNAEFFMKTGPEADPAYLRDDGILVEGLVQFYVHASIGRAGTVRKNLHTLKLRSTVPERNCEKPKEVSLGIIRAVEASGDDGEVLYTVHTYARETGMAVHHAVPAPRLRAAAGRDFDAAKETEQADFLEHLRERIGPDPGGEQWKNEVVSVIKEQGVQDGYIKSMEDEKYEAPVWALSFEAFCAEYKDSIYWKQRTNNNLTLAEAQLYEVFSAYAAVLATATREARADYAGLTHAYYNLIARLAEDAAPAVDCYLHLQGTTVDLTLTGLQDSEPGWELLVRQAVAAAKHDGSGKLHGVHCLTSAGAVMVVPAEPRCLAPEGFRQGNSTKGGQMETQNSPVVCFVSAARDAVGYHTAVHIDPMNCVYPPMTLFSAIDVQLGSFEYDGTADLVRQLKADSEYGGRCPTPVPSTAAGGRPHIGRQQLLEWLAENDEDEDSWWKSDSELHEGALNFFHKWYLPLNVESTIYTINRTLVTVQATYLPLAAPAAADAAAADAAGADTFPTTTALSTKPTNTALDKLTANSSELGYGDRMSYVRGVAEIVFALQMTMAEEWARNHQWSDWTGGSFCGQDEFDYVWNQPAVEDRNGAVGFDKGHGGMMLADFRQLFVDLVRAAGGDDELMPTLEEVAAARLYTGPAYVKLNGFMRLIGGIPERRWRARFAQLRHFTYSCTVHHLINAIRKITLIASLLHGSKEGSGNEEIILYRGVRGKLPDSFFKPDVQGFITAVDFGFVSTSTDAGVPVSFMAPDALNVLWVMHGSHGADSAGQLHNGAVLQLLSQFPAEAETLLPPLCMLQVLKDEATGNFRMEDKVGENKKGEAVRFKEIHVRPCFV